MIGIDAGDVVGLEVELVRQLPHVTGIADRNAEAVMDHHPC